MHEVENPVVLCEACGVSEPIDPADVRSAVGFIRSHQMHGDVFFGDDMGDGDVACICVVYHPEGEA